MTSEGRDTSRSSNDPRGLWAAAARPEGWLSTAAGVRESQEAWRRAVESDFPPDGDITCDPWTLMPLATLVVCKVGVTGPPPELVQGVLSEAAVRMLNVTATGQELTDDEYEEWEERGGEDDDDYTPNYVSEPRIWNDIVGIDTIDTKGERYPWMFRTFLRIVAEELRAAGAVPARIIPFLTPDTLAWMAQHGELYPIDVEFDLD